MFSENKLVFRRFRNLGDIRNITSKLGVKSFTGTNQKLGAEIKRLGCWHPLLRSFPEARAYRIEGVSVKGKQISGKVHFYSMGEETYSFLIDELEKKRA